MVSAESSTFGVLLRRHRVEAGLTQEQLAERAQVSPRSIRDLERGVTHAPRAYTVRKLCKALHLIGDDQATFAGSARASAVSVPPAMDTDQPLVAERAAEGEAVRTFLIADIRNYTRFTAERGDQMAARLVAKFAMLARDCVAARDGEVIEFRGDEILAVFRSPRQALRAGLELQDQLTRETDSDPTTPLEAGIGVDAGEAVPVEGGYRGGALNLAARLCNLAGPGEVLTTEGMTHLAGKLDGFAYLDRGRAQLKGLNDPVSVVQILAEGAAPTHRPPLHIFGFKPSNLPQEMTSFVGRQCELDNVLALVRSVEVRLLTLTGPGGTGKTRIALRVARDLLAEFEHGVFFVSLGSINDPTLVTSAIAEALVVKEIAGQPILETIKAHLFDKQVLLVLDNFEHLLDAAPLVATLLAGCRRLKVLATSRAALRLYGEYHYGVPPLATPEPAMSPDVSTLSRFAAVELFVERARAAKPDFTLSKENAASVAQISRSLDGLPLAIELAAARIRVLPPAIMLQRLDQRLKILTSAARDIPEHQQTIRATIDWSYSLLQPVEQRLFAQLAVFAGGWTLASAEAVCGAEALAGLLSLEEQSLVHPVETANHGSGARFAMLETIREHALEKLAASGDNEALRARHAHHYLALSENSKRHFEVRDQVVWLEMMDAEDDNMRAALRWAIDREEADFGLRLVGELHRFWYMRAHFTEGRMWATAVLRLSTGLDGTALAKALRCAGELTAIQGDYERGVPLLEQSLSQAQGAGDQEEVAYVLSSLGILAAAQERYDEATTLWEQSSVLFRAIGDTAAVAKLLDNLGGVVAYQGDYERAERLVAESLALARGRGDKGDIAEALHDLGLIALRRGDDERAAELLREGLDLSRKESNRQLAIFCIEGLARAAALSGDIARAARLWGAAEGVCEAIDMPLLPPEQALHAEAVGAARSRLDEVAFSAAWTNGRVMSLDTASRYALGEEEQGRSSGL